MIMRETIAAALQSQFSWLNPVDRDRLAYCIDELPAVKSKVEHQFAVAKLLQSWRLPYTVAAIVSIAGGSRSTATDMVLKLLQAAASAAGHATPPVEAVTQSSAASTGDDNNPGMAPAQLDQILAVVAAVHNELVAARADFQWVKTTIDTERQLALYRGVFGPLPPPASPLGRTSQISGFMAELQEQRHTRVGPMPSQVAPDDAAID